MIEVRPRAAGPDDREAWMSRVGGAAPLRVAVALLVALPPATTLTVTTGTAAAAPTAVVPSVGECLDLPAESLADRAGWLDPVPVPCTEPHTFEVTRVGLLPAIGDSEDPTEVAARQCGALGVWNEVGVNRPMAGVVRNPLRVEARSFAIREPEPRFVCGAVAVEWVRGGEVVVLPLTSSIEELSIEQREALRYCSRARGIKRPWTNPTTVSCSTQPRWEATAWVLWTAFYDEDPGRARLRTRAKDICGEAARVSLPRARDWTSGLPWTRCYERRS